MIKGSVCIENDSPQEARRGINKLTSTDPFSEQFGPFDSLTGLPSSYITEEVVRHHNRHNSPAQQKGKLVAAEQHLKESENACVERLEGELFFFAALRPAPPSAAYVYSLLELH